MVKIENKVFLLVIFLVSIIAASFLGEAIPITEADINLVLDDRNVTPNGFLDNVGYLLFDNHRPVVALPPITNFSFYIYEPLNYFNWSYSNFSSDIGDETLFINISATLPIGFSKNVFERELFLSYNIIDGNTTKNQNKTFKFNVSVPKYKNYTLDFGNNTYNISIGSNGVLGNFTLKNIGNVDLSLSTNSSTCSFLNVPKAIPLYRMIEETVHVQYDVPKDTVVENKTCEITLSENNIADRSVTYNITLSDLIKPEFKNITVFDVMSTRNAAFFAEISDNLGIKRVWFEYGQNNKEINATYLPDSSRYSISFLNLTELNSYNYTFFAEDTNGNIAKANGTFSIIELDSLKLNKTVDFKKIRYGSTTQSQEFLTVLYKTPINLRFYEVKYDCGRVKNESIVQTEVNESWFNRNILGKTNRIIIAKKESDEPVNCVWKTIITYPSGEKKYIDYSDVNKTLFLEEEGIYKIAVSGEQLGGLYGTIRFGTIPEHKKISDLTIISEFVDYDVPIEKMSDTFSWGTRECNYLDEGTYESSRTECVEVHYCEKGVCDARRLGATMTPEEKEMITNVYTSRINEKEDVIESQSLRLYTLFFISILAFSYIGYTVYFSKYLSE